MKTVAMTVVTSSCSRQTFADLLRDMELFKALMPAGAATKVGPIHLCFDSNAPIILFCDPA